jgi:hypothetical protein
MEVNCGFCGFVEFYHVVADLCRGSCIQILISREKKFNEKEKKLSNEIELSKQKLVKVKANKVYRFNLFLLIFMFFYNETIYANFIHCLLFAISFC